MAGGDPVVDARRGTAATVILAWLVAGSLDITAALTYYPLTTNLTAERLLQGIASGVLDGRAFTGGWSTAALGLALHYLIALIWTVIFYVVASMFPSLLKRLVPTGLAYGIVVWAGMNLVVLPLSRVHRGPFSPAQAVIAAVILMICIGLPIAGIFGTRLRRSV